MNKGGKKYNNQEIKIIEPQTLKIMNKETE